VRPSCHACDGARQACTYERLPRPLYPGGKALSDSSYTSRKFSDYLTCIRYISVLEERIAFLEARLPDHAEDHFDNITGGVQQEYVPAVDASFTSPQNRRGSCRASQSQAGSTSEDVDFDEGTTLVDGVAYLSLCASGTTDTNQEPFYVGSSSGATIARVIQSSIYRGSVRRQSEMSEPIRHNQVQNSPDLCVHHADAESSEYTSAFPDQAQARLMFDFFFERIHPRWPLLDRVVYEKVFEKQYLSGALSIAERSILHLIYAITARFLAVTKKPCGVDDEVGLAQILPVRTLTRMRSNLLRQRTPWSIY
jgi:hypothetical protein